MTPKPNMENFYSRETETQNVSAIHFLIHPGFWSEGLAKAENLEIKKKFDPLLEEYKKLVQEIQARPAEILILAVPERNTPATHPLHEGTTEYREFLTYVTETLGNRAILLGPSEDPIPDKVNMEAVANYIQRILKERGFSYAPDVLSKAYGEMVEQCVATGAIKLNQALALKRPTIIDPTVSDVAAPAFDRESRVEKLTALEDRTTDSPFIEIRVE